MTVPHAPDLRERLTELVAKWRERAGRLHKQASLMPGQRTNHQLYEQARYTGAFADELEAVLVSALAPLAEAATTTIIEIEHVHRIVWLSCGHRFQVVSMGNLRCNVGDRWPCGLCDEGVSALAPLVPTETFTESGWALRRITEFGPYWWDSELWNNGPMATKLAVVVTREHADAEIEYQRKRHPEMVVEAVRVTRTVTVRTEAP